jgi:solute carrier family 25 oxoglutarate transporter 11
MCVHPFDLIKVRMQLNNEAVKAAVPGVVKYKSMLQAGAHIVKSENGVRALYKGLSAGLARQITYSTTRLGMYDVLRTRFIAPGEDSFIKKAACGLAAGAIAAMVCNPVEVCLVRMQADGLKPVAERRGYTNIMNALWRVGSEEGVLTYWRGVGPTVARAMVVCATQLSTYDHAKYMYRDKFHFLKDGVLLHFASSLTAGLIYSYCTLPLDMAKTRMQNEKVTAGARPLYRNIPQTIGMVAKEEGVFALWKGFATYFARCGGHSVTMFLFLEQYRKLTKWAYQNYT